MNVYLAGKWADRQDIHQKILQLESLGFNITHDWTQVETPENRTKDNMGQMAKWDIDGVKSADLVIFLMTDPKYAYRGSFTELGASLALDKSVMVICAQPDPELSYCASNVFFHHPGAYHVRSWEQALSELKVLIDLKKPNPTLPADYLAPPTSDKICSKSV